MEIRHLRYFTAVASELHFARAAERLNISPPTLTHQIKWLESYLGVTLFNRGSKKRVELTFAGKQFQKRALSLIDAFEQAERFAKEAARGAVGDVRLGYVFAAATADHIRQIIETAGKTLPNVLVRISRLETLPQIKALATGSLDIGLVRSMDTYPAGIESFDLPPQLFCLAMHRDHPLAKQETVTPAALAKEQFVAYELDAEIGFWRNILAVMPAGAIPQISHRVPDAYSLLTMVSANAGIAVIPESLKNIASSHVVVRNIAGPPRYSKFSVIYRTADASPAARAVVDIIQKAFGT